jgi:CTP synthase
VEVNIKWIDAEEITEANVEDLLGDVDGVLVPGGFGTRGVEGKMIASRYAREHNKPYFGICLGMQIAMIEFARNVMGWQKANTTEIDDVTPYPVIDFLPGQSEESQRGGTLRLGSYPCHLLEGTKVYKIYGTDLIHERHRHRYEVNNEYVKDFEAAGMVFGGQAPDKSVMEMIELPGHPWFVACQFHPEFKSRPNKAHPLFASFIKSALETSKK